MTISSILFCRPLDQCVAPRPERPSSRCSIGCAGSSDEYRIVARATRSTSFEGRRGAPAEPGSANRRFRTRSDSRVFMISPAQPCGLATIAHDDADLPFVRHRERMLEQREPIALVLLGRFDVGK